MPLAAGVSPREERAALLGGVAGGRSIAPRNRAKRDIDAVGPVDGGDRQGEISPLFLAELRAGEREDIVRNILVRELRNRFRPGERRALALAVEGAFAPGAQK